MNKEQLIGFFQSRTFKKTTFVLGIFFIVATLFFTFKPDIFLKFGYLGIFLFNALGGSGTILFPVLVKDTSVFGLSFSTSIGMAINDSVAWVVGSSGGSLNDKKPIILKIENSVKKFGIIAFFFWSILPFPYDIVGFVAGYLNVPYLSYMIPTFLGKFVRFLLFGFGINSILE